MKSSTWQADGQLLVAAIIWGLAFVAQRAGMEHIGPFVFNTARFTLGCLSLLPLIWLHRPIQSPSFRHLLGASLAAGALLFAGSSLQQIGLVYTTAGNAGFITGLYIVLVPMIALLWRHTTEPNTWLGAVIALIGLFTLSVTDELTLAYGDLLELIGALFWAGHVLLIGWLCRRIDPIRLALGQFVVCGLLSLGCALIWETFEIQAITAVWIPISYAGILSVGVAYTLQVVAQRNAPAAHAAVILSLESVFAALGGWLLLNESLDLRGVLGCAIMLTGMLVSQLPAMQRKPRSEIT